VWSVRRKGHKPVQQRRRPRPPLQLEPLEQRFCPSYSLVTSHTALAGTDSLNWGTLGAPGTQVANPFTIVSTNGQSVTVSKTLSGDFQTWEQIPPTTPTNAPFNGNFAPGDILLGTTGLGSCGSGNQSIVLNFGSQPVAAGGAQIEPGIPGSFTAQIQALDASGKVLASFTEDGTATNAHDNSAIFLGISSTSSSIAQLAIHLTKAPAGNDKAEFYINEFDFRTSAPAAAPGTSSAVGSTAPVVNSPGRSGTPEQTAGPEITSLMAAANRDANLSATLTQLAFSLERNKEGTNEAGTESLRGNASAASLGVWAFPFTVNRTRDSHTLFSQAEDGYGAFVDPRARTPAVP
jgi:hypothetical protein